MKKIKKIKQRHEARPLPIITIITILIKDNREPFDVIQKNDPAKLNYKSE